MNRFQGIRRKSQLGRGALLYEMIRSGLSKHFVSQFSMVDPWLRYVTIRLRTFRALIGLWTRDGNHRAIRIFIEARVHVESR